MRSVLLCVLVLTGCILRGGAESTYHVGSGVALEGTATASLGGRGYIGPGAAMGATVLGGYDFGFGGPTGTIGPSVEYFSPGGDWTLAALGTCGGRFGKANGKFANAVSCEVRVGPSHILSYDGGTARWAGMQLVLRAAFAGDAPAEGFSIGLAGTWENWLTYGAPVKGTR